MPVTITSVENPFEPHARVIETHDFKGPCLTDYLQVVDDLTQYIVIVNDALFDAPDLGEVVISDGDVITIGAKVRGEAIGAFAYWVASNVALAAGGVSAATYAAVYTASALTALFTVGYGMSQVLSALSPSIGYTDPDANTVYGWDQLQQTETEGNAIPVLFGTHRVGGQVINQFTRTYVTIDNSNYDGVTIASWLIRNLGAENEKYGYSLSNGEYWEVPTTYGINAYDEDTLELVTTMEDLLGYINEQQGTGTEDQDYLYMLLAVAAHEVDEITDITINEQKTNYYDSVTGYTRLGTGNDDPIPGFGELIQQHSFEYKLEQSHAVTYETDGNAVEKINLVFKFHSGLGYANDDGSYGERTVTWTIEYKTISAGSWTLWSDDGSGSIAYTGAQSEAITLTYQIDTLSADQYMVRVTRTSEDPATWRDLTDLYFVGLQEVVKEELIYPGIAKYAICALATNQLSGSMPAVTATVTRSRVTVYDADAGAWVTKSATNPAWICYAILNTYRGIPADRIVWDDFLSWAEYCDENIAGDGEEEEKRFQVSIVFDTLADTWSQAQRVALLGNAVLIQRGSSYGVFVDRPETTVSHLFTMGNIDADTFQLKFLPKLDLANNVEVTYVDPDRDYSTQVVAVYSTEYLNATTVSKKTSIQVKAAIPRPQAIRMAAFSLNSNLLLTKIVEFEADIDSFRCILGDLVYFQHDVPDYKIGIGGLIASAGNDDGAGNPYIQLDREFEFVAGKSYAVLVRLSDDTLVEKTIINPETTTDTVTVTAAWTVIPDHFDLYEMGLTSSYKKIYRITNIARAGDLKKRLTLMEYVEAIYSDDGYVIEEPPDDGGGEPLTEIQYARNVTLTEHLTYGAGGDFASIVNVTWQSGTTNNDREWAIWWQDITYETGFSSDFVASVGGSPATGGISGTPARLGLSTGFSFVVPSDILNTGHTYRCYVTPKGQGPLDSGTNTQIINIVGKLAPPADVSGFTLAWNSVYRELTFAWDAVADIDLAGYEIRWGSTAGLDWDTAQGLVATDLTGTVHTITLTPYTGTLYYWIKALDTSGIYSATAAAASIEIDTTEVGGELETPTGLSLSTYSSVGPDGTTHTYIIASWDDTNASLDYFGYYGLVVTDTDSGKVTVYSNLDVNELQFEVQPNRSYSVRVRVYDESGKATLLSDPVTITASKDEGAPATPTWPSTSAIIPGFKVIGLNWNDNTEEDLAHYEIQRSATGAFSGEEVSIGKKDGSFTTDTDLSVATQYWYRIRAVDTSGNASGWSTSQTATTTQVGSSDIAYNSIIAEHLTSTNVSAYFGSFGVMEAGKLQDYTGYSYWDLNNRLIRIGTSSKALMYFNGSQLVVNTDVIFTDGINDNTLGELAYIDTVGNSNISTISGSKIRTGAIESIDDDGMKIDLDNDLLSFGSNARLQFGVGTYIFGESGALQLMSGLGNPTITIVSSAGTYPGIKMTSTYGDIEMIASKEISMAAGTNYSIDITSAGSGDVNIDASGVTGNLNLSSGSSAKLKSDGGYLDLDAGTRIYHTTNGEGWYQYESSGAFGLRPNTNGEGYLGDASAAWNTIHCYAYYDEGGLGFQDVQDDLAILRQLQPVKKDGTIQIDAKTGFADIDLLSVPRAYTNYEELYALCASGCPGMISEDDFEAMLADGSLGWKLRRNMSRWNDLTNGALRQIDTELTQITEDFMTLIKNLDKRLSDLEATK